MVATHDRALHLEDVLRVAHVLKQRRRHLVYRGHDVGESLHPGLENRILRIPLVQGDGAVVRIDDCLDRVAHVVELILRLKARWQIPRGARIARRIRKRDTARIGVVIRCRVGVNDPLDASVDNDRVRILVNRQEGSDLLHAQRRVAIPQDARVGVHEIGQQQVRVLELGGKHESVEQRTHRHAAGTVVRICLLAGGAGVIWVIKLDRRGALRGAHDAVEGRKLAEVHPRLIDLQLTSGRNIAFEEVGLTIAQCRVVVGRDEAIAVRVHGPVVGPVALTVGNAGKVDLTHGNHGTAVFATDVVSVDVETIIERVVAANLLQLVVGRRNKGRIKQANIRKGADVIFEHLLRGK